MRRRREILVELISLLDVILIMLFVLLLQARTQTEQAQTFMAESTERIFQLEERLERAEAERSEAVFERDALARRILTDSLVLENSRILTVSVQPDGKILAEIENGAVREIEYRWEEGDQTGKELFSAGEEFLRSLEGRPAFLVFQYDRNRIYHAEYEVIASVIQQLREKAGQEGIPLSTIEADLFGMKAEE